MWRRLDYAREFAGRKQFVVFRYDETNSFGLHQLDLVGLDPALLIENVLQMLLAATEYMICELAADCKRYVLGVSDW